MNVNVKGFSEAVESAATNAFLDISGRATACVWLPELDRVHPLANIFPVKLTVPSTAKRGAEHRETAAEAASKYFFIFNISLGI
ncbi:hypothetical protein SOASR031_12730 [Leminorella grimontii]|nr:hypothetical protein SOASR031_12730 [Leminorella grimontii]